MPTKKKKRPVQHRRPSVVPDPVASTPDENPKSKWKPLNLVWVYRYAKLGMSEHAIAEAFEVSTKTFQIWKKKRPEIQEALDLGRTKTEDGGDFHNYIFERLSPDVRAVWDKLCEYNTDDVNGVVKIETLLSDHGKGIRQQLFVYALVDSNFSASRAMHKVNISKETLDYWIAHDPGFANLIDEIQWHKGNFFEESLVSLVKMGVPAAVLFANKTFNRERGYTVKTELNVQHSGQVDLNLVDLTQLDLSASVKSAILDAIRKMEEKNRMLDVTPLPLEQQIHSKLLDTIASPQESIAEEV